jgi:hypothetical protein
MEAKLLASDEARFITAATPLRACAAMASATSSKRRKSAEVPMELLVVLIAPAGRI